MTPLQALWATLVIVSLLYLAELAWSKIERHRRMLRLHRALMNHLREAQARRERRERMR